jgi:hypothetical protein
MGRQFSAALSFVCQACLTAWWWKSTTQPDGGEELANRKSAPVKVCLKEAESKRAN